MTYTGEMVLPRNAVMMTEDEMTYTEGGGFVGLYVKLSKTMQKYTKAVIVGAVTGAFAWVGKGLLAFGLAGAVAWGALSAVVAILTASVVGDLKLGKTIPIGVNVSGITLNKTITIG